MLASAMPTTGKSSASRNSRRPPSSKQPITAASKPSASASRINSSIGSKTACSCRWYSRWVGRPASRLRITASCSGERTRSITSAVSASKASEPTGLTQRIRPIPSALHDLPGAHAALRLEVEDRAAEDPVAVVGAGVDADRRADLFVARRLVDVPVQAEQRLVAFDRLARRPRADTDHPRPAGVGDRAQLLVEFGRLVEVRLERRAVEVEDGLRRIAQLRRLS